MNNLSIEELKEMRAYASARYLERFVRLIDETIAIRELKGDQVPVAWRMWPEGDYDEGFIVNHDEDPVKDPTATDAKGQRWISSPLYDRPQKPIVNELIGMLESEIGHSEINDIRLPKRLGEKEGRHAVPVEYLRAIIVAAGGVVKDGE